MRRILRKIAAGEEDSIGDTTTLADPTVVARLISKFKVAYSPRAVSESGSGKY
jgi:acetyl-CoA synthetase